MAAHAPTRSRPSAPRPPAPSRPGAEFDLAALDRIKAVDQIGRQTVVAQIDTADEREIRITAKRDLATGQYQAEYERRVPLEYGGKAYLIWSKIRTYAAIVAANPETCLKQALEDVNRLHLY